MLAFTPRSLAAPGGSEWPSQVKHLSASSLALFSECPEKYRRRYLEGVKTPPNGYLLWGRADHAAIQRDLEHRMDYGKGLSTDDVLDVFNDEWRRALADNEDVVWDEGETAGSILDRGVKLVAVYHREVCPTIKPVAVEKKYEIRIPGSPVPILGFVDIETASQVIDRKTSGKRVNTPLPQWWVQRSVYSLFTGKPVQWHVSVKTKEPYVLTGPELLSPVTNPVVTRAWAASIVQQISHCYEVFGPEDAWPGSGLTHPWACNGCGYRPTCSWWSS